MDVPRVLPQRRPRLVVRGLLLEGDGGSGQSRCDRTGGALRRALVGAKENLMPGCHRLSSVLLLAQIFFEAGGCKGKSLPTKTHQVGVLKPRMTEAVLDRGTGPVEEAKWCKIGSRRSPICLV